MATDGGVAPELASWTGDTFLVQCAGDGARADVGGELAEDAPDNIRLGFVDLAVPANGITARIELLDDIVAKAQTATRFAVLDAATNAAMGFGGGVPFSRKAVFDAFDEATSYNEWTVRDADTIGIFVKLTDRLPEVWKVVDIMAHPDCDEAMGNIEPQVCPVGIELAEIVDTFPNFPVYGFLGTDIIQIGIDINHVYSNRQS